MRYLKEGWRLASREPFAIATLFLFHFIWGLLFYQFVQGHVVDIMERFPPPELGGERVNLFLYESMLLLQQSDIAMPALWTLLAYVGMRMLLTPMLHAGVYHSLYLGSGARGTVFIRGLRRFGGSFTWLYLLRLLLTAIPLYWALPAAANSFAVSSSYAELLLRLSPWVLGIAAYGAMLKLVFTYVLFALISDEGLLRNLSFAIRHFPKVCGLALSVFGSSLLLHAIILSLSLYWAGFVSILLYLAYPLLQIWLKVWAISVQHRYWQLSKN